MVGDLVDNVMPLVPFTTPYFVRGAISRQAKTILDVGCGKGIRMAAMRLSRKESVSCMVGADIFYPYIERCRKDFIHDDYVWCDVRHLPFREKSFDTVLCLDVLEHMTRGDGLNLIGEMEAIARAQVIVSTPIGEMVQDSYDANPYQEHIGCWYPNDFEEMGYRIKRLGFLWKHGRRRPLRDAAHVGLLRPLQVVVYPLAGLLVALYPKLASAMVAVKELR
jgi:SAM-dependent methyltransferase